MGRRRSCLRSRPAATATLPPPDSTRWRDAVRAAHRDARSAAPALGGLAQVIKDSRCRSAGVYSPLTDPPAPVVPRRDKDRISATRPPPPEARSRIFEAGARRQAAATRAPLAPAKEHHPRHAAAHRAPPRYQMVDAGDFRCVRCARTAAEPRPTPTTAGSAADAAGSPLQFRAVSDPTLGPSHTDHRRHHLRTRLRRRVRYLRSPPGPGALPAAAFLRMSIRRHTPAPLPRPSCRRSFRLRCPRPQRPLPVAPPSPPLRSCGPRFSPAAGAGPGKPPPQPAAPWVVSRHVRRRAGNHPAGNRRPCSADSSPPASVATPWSRIPSQSWLRRRPHRLPVAVHNPLSPAPVAPAPALRIVRRSPPAAPIVPPASDSGIRRQRAAPSPPPGGWPLLSRLSLSPHSWWRHRDAADPDSPRRLLRRRFPVAPGRSVKRRAAAGR